MVLFKNGIKYGIKIFHWVNTVYVLRHLFIPTNPQLARMSFFFRSGYFARRGKIVFFRLFGLGFGLELGLGLGFGLGLGL